MIRSSSKRVSLSLQAAKALREPYAEPWALTELARAIAGAESPKKKAAKKQTRKTTATRRAEKRETWLDLRARVFERDGNACCHCGVKGSQFNPLAGDHFFGRARSESLESVWALCWIGHRQKTDSEPDAATWLLRFIAHAERHGYRHEASKARARLDFVNSRASAGLPFSTESEP